MAQAQIGKVVFGVETSAYDELRTSRAYEWAKRERYATTPARELVTVAPPRIELTGKVVAEDGSDYDALAAMRRESERGEKLPFFLGGDATKSGDYLGRWIITELQTDERIINRDGKPAVVRYTLTLEYADG